MSNCRFCGKPFEPRKAGGRKQVYCSPDCRLQHYNLGTRLQPLDPNTPPNKQGGREAQCPTCDKLFMTRTRGGGRRQRYCSDQCWRAMYVVLNPHKKLEHKVAKYGMSAEDYLQLLSEQGGVCAICKQAPKSISLAVDHDHTTGAVRGLLCAPCNRHVGYFERVGEAVQRYLLTAKAAPVRFVAKKRKPPTYNDYVKAVREALQKMQGQASINRVDTHGLSTAHGTVEVLKAVPDNNYAEGEARNV